MRFLVGLDQLSLGARTKCDLFDTDGDIAVPQDTSISQELITDLKKKPVKGLFVSRDDFLDIDMQSRGLDRLAAVKSMEWIRNSMEFRKPLSEAAHREALSLASETLTEAGYGRPVDYAAIEDLSRHVQSDICKNPFLILNPPKCGNPADYLMTHSVNVMINMLALASKLGVEDVTARKMAVGAFLHDIGKVQVDNAIVEKPGNLTDNEFTQIKNHPLLGLKIVMKGLDITDEACRVVLHHHERFDGKGYPMKLGREAISKGGRMMAIVDAFDAMTNDRVYAKRLTGHHALNRIIADSGAQFDPRLTHEFLSLSGAYPDGSVVELNTGEIGVVTSQNIGNIVSPRLDIYFNPSRKALPKPRSIDLSSDLSRFIKVEFPDH